MFRKKGCEARVVPARIDERIPFEMPPETAVMYLSFAKAAHVARQEKGIVIAADTIVVFEGEIITKPRDEAEAFEILSRLRGQTHQVITGVCLIDTARTPVRKRCLYEVTDVVFGTYTDEELRAYVRTEEPYDKAGGYAIQETFGRYVDHIRGDLNNVIGFPMYRVEPYLE